MVKEKAEAEEEKDPMVHICRCKKCGYIGRISFARYGDYNEILGEFTYDCPKCGNDLWEEDVKCVWRDEEEKEIEILKKNNVLPLIER